MDEQVLKWVQEAPLTDPARQRLLPNFNYDDWFARGRALATSSESLARWLAAEDLAKPSGQGMRMAYALGWLGRREPAVVAALRRALGSSDLALRGEAASALGRLKDEDSLPLLQDILQDRSQHANARGNAAVGLGLLGSAKARGALQAASQDPDSFVAACAVEGLRLLQAGPGR